MNWRKIFLILAIIFILTGVFLPRDWYDVVPKSEIDLTWIKHHDEPNASPQKLPPIKGVTLLQISFVIEGLVFLWFGLKRCTYTRLSADQLLLITTEENKNDFGTTSFWLITAITVLALVLRLFRLDSELWLDEITPIFFYSPMPTLHVLTGFASANNHLLNTLLMKLAIAFFGEQEWAVRLPAAIFGVATIPVFYWLSRLILTQRSSICATLLLAVSYHHIFYSQNSRGYTMQMFFTILASWLFLKGLQKDCLKIWILYVAAMFFNMATILNSSFVIAAHLLVGAAALVIIKQRGDSPVPLLYRLIAVFGIITLLVFQLYATFIPQAYIYTQQIYSIPGNGFSPFSMEFATEMIRGISAGFGTSLIFLVFPFAAIVAAVGLVASLKRNWALTALLVLPFILTFAYLLINRLNIAPRFLLLVFPFAILVMIQGIDSVFQLIADKVSQKPNTLAAKLATAMVLLGCVVSLASLRRYYAVPKQPYRTSLAFIEARRQPGEIIIAIHHIENGYRFYAEEFNLIEDVDLFYVRSVEKLDSVLSKHGERGVYLVTTFQRSLRFTVPDLEAQIARDWEEVQVFPATLGDAEVRIWRHHHSD
ncbi:MAG: glycosyltransferase family 39 protein [Acidobacteria bacterium]|jgi:4-amino-4-deoxy-L-arabinose transferase-like glycosyltransferase|nr:glycosyltransferase family 39 protein [Acidobacteriota bacterium]